MESDTGEGGAYRTLTLEAYADTFVPGAKRGPSDLAIAGAASGPGAVEAGALRLLETPATGVSEGLTSLAGTLNEHAMTYAADRGLAARPDAPPFVALSFPDRTALVRELIAPGHPEKDIWIPLHQLHPLLVQGLRRFHRLAGRRLAFPRRSAAGGPPLGSSADPSARSHPSHRA